ncbi:neurogenic locus Notch protein [Caerostris extrusa]|uniref:Neurogenic locus Notch protein n=1 Tax=Caerostris extrusa TaxID=172846 RepID=A0AAV4VPP4_CAEEX|nr:neurogenic locus Notch protein [Caerostris extrusa]
MIHPTNRLLELCLMKFHVEDQIGIDNTQLIPRCKKAERETMADFSTCPPMYVGEYCEHLNPCHTGPGPRCQNGGTCNMEMSVTNGPTFSCTCPVGYSASLCEIVVQNSCNSNPCLNGGTCTLVTLTNYTCSCAVGYRGRHCQLPDHCASQPCRNSASCHSLKDTYRCTCARGFTGTNCTTDIDECRQDLCVNGRCINTVGSYRCNCSPGYTGLNCDSQYIPCDPSPCINGGTCRHVDTFNYQCSCPPGYAYTSDPCFVWSAFAKFRLPFNGIDA